MKYMRKMHVYLLLGLLLTVGSAGSLLQARYEAGRMKQELRLVIRAVASLVNMVDPDEWDTAGGVMPSGACLPVQRMLRQIDRELPSCRAAALMACKRSDVHVLYDVEQSPDDAAWSREMNAVLIAIMHDRIWKEKEAHVLGPVRADGAFWLIGCAPVEQRMADGGKIAVVVLLSGRDFYGRVCVRSMTPFVAGLAASFLLCIFWFFIQRLQQTGKQLEQARGDAEAANVAKTQFLTVMGHELRTPLNPVVGYASLLQDEFEKGSMEYELIGDISQSAADMLGVIQQVLKVSAADLNELQPHPVSTTLQALKQCVDSYGEPLAGGKSVQFSSELCRGDAELCVDRGLLEQILRHLIANAVKFTDTGGHIRVELAVLTDNGGSTYFQGEVIDDGTPVPPKWVSTLFDPLAKGGYGAGSLRLAVARNMAQQMGGDVTYRPSKEGGACFAVCAPITPQR